MGVGGRRLVMLLAMRRPPHRSHSACVVRHSWNPSLAQEETVDIYQCSQRVKSRSNDGSWWDVFRHPLLVVVKLDVAEWILAHGPVCLISAERGHWKTHKPLRHTARPVPHADRPNSQRPTSAGRIEPMPEIF